MGKLPIFFLLLGNLPNKIYILRNFSYFDDIHKILFLIYSCHRIKMTYFRQNSFKINSLSIKIREFYFQ